MNRAVVRLSEEEYEKWKGEERRTEEEKAAKKAELKREVEKAMSWWCSRGGGEREPLMLDNRRRIELGLAGLSPYGRGNGMGGGGFPGPYY